MYTYVRKIRKEMSLRDVTQWGELSLLIKHTFIEVTGIDSINAKDRILVPIVNAVWEFF